MSIILKGIDIPKKDQVIVIHSDGTFNEVDPFARRLMPFYEAIQISKDHGRIADVGEGERKMCGECQFKDSDCLKDSSIFCTDREIFSLAPTILEAET